MKGIRFVVCELGCHMSEQVSHVFPLLKLFFSTMLQRRYLNNNNFSGPIPAEWSAMESLGYLWVLDLLFDFVYLGNFAW